MEVGVREFRSRLSELVKGTEPVAVTSNGRRLGTYVPARRPKSPEMVREAAEAILAWQAKLRAEGVEPEDVLAEMGLDPWGAPLDPAAK